jgi:cold shock CspA family protein
MSDIETLLTGTVKWFNDQSGFGFITVCDEGPFKNKDIFAHYSAIRVSNSQYKYLVQGEYVNFKLINVHGGRYEYQASDISGINNGPIMCEVNKNSQNKQHINKGPRKLYSPNGRVKN